MGRSPSSNNNYDDLKKGPWTPEEDQILSEYIHKHEGHGSWRALPKRAGLNRCGKSCRLRWCNYLRPDIKRGKFTENEEQVIVKLHSALGNKWSKIAAHLPGRTDNEIKNFWNTHIRKKLVKSGIDPKTHQPIFDANVFVTNFSHLMLSNTNLSANLMSPLGSALMRLKSYLSQPSPNAQLLLSLWQLINSNNTNPIPSTIEQTHNLMQSSYNLSQYIGLVNGTNTSSYSMDGSIDGNGSNTSSQEPSAFHNMNANPQIIGNSSTFLGHEFGTEVVHNSNLISSMGSRACSVQTEDVLLPALVSASSTPETIGVNQIYTTASNQFEDWEKLVDDEETSSFWRNLLIDM